MNRQREYQTRSQSKKSGLEVSSILQRRGAERSTSVQRMQREEDTNNHTWTESLLEKNFKPIPLRSPKARGSETEGGSEALRASAVRTQETSSAPIQAKEAATANKTGLPDRLKTGIEHLSGYSMDDVKVHYNSDKPARLQAHAYAQGTDIHIAPGQEKHLPHEAWHVVQQMQGRVKPTMQAKGVVINDDRALEREADLMGVKAASEKRFDSFPSHDSQAAQYQTIANPQKKETVQRSKAFKWKKGETDYRLEASGKPSEFSGGSNAGPYGIGRVDYYRGTYSASNQLNIKGHKTGKPKYEQSNWMDNKQPEYANGHLLPKEFGGYGKKDNVFEQEGGQNTGSWRSFEIAASNVLKKTPPDETFTYTMELKGKKLEYTW